MDCTLVFTDGGTGDGHNGSKACRAAWSYAIKTPGKGLLPAVAGLVDGVGTNNIAELKAIQFGLEATVGSKFPILVVTDSKLCMDTFVEWYSGWRSRGWKRSNGSAPANLDIIKRIVGIIESMEVPVFFMHVNSHRTAPPDTHMVPYLLWRGNDRVDAAATAIFTSSPDPRKRRRVGGSEGGPGSGTPRETTGEHGGPAGAGSKRK